MPAAPPRSASRDWFAALIAHVVALLASGVFAIGIVAFGLLMTLPFEGQPTASERNGAALVMAAAGLTVLLPQVLLAWIRVCDGHRRSLGREASATVAAFLVVVGAIVGTNQLALAHQHARAEEAQRAELASAGIVLYRPTWLPPGYERRQVRVSGHAVSVTYAPPPKAPNFPEYVIEERPADDPAVAVEPVAVSDQATLTVRYPRTVVTLTAVWDAARDPRAMRRTMRSLTPGSPV